MTDLLTTSRQRKEPQTSTIRKASPPQHEQRSTNVNTQREYVIRECRREEAHEQQNGKKNKIKENVLCIVTYRILLSILYCGLTTIYLYFWVLKDIPTVGEHPFRIVISANVGVMLGIALAVLSSFSVRLWCTLSVAVPEMSTNRGRAVALSIIVGILLQGPVTNILHNNNEINESYQCAIDKIKSIGENYKTQYDDMIYSLKKLSGNIFQKVEQMQEQLKTAKRTWDSIITKVGPMFKALESINCLGGLIECDRVSLTNPNVIEHHNTTLLNVTIALCTVKNNSDSRDLKQGTIAKQVIDE